MKRGQVEETGGGMTASGQGYVEPMRELISEAQREAGALGHKSVGTEHLFLALLGQKGSVASVTLDRLRCNRDDLRLRVLSIIGQRKAAAHDGHALALTTRGTEALASAEAAARDRGSEMVGTEHLLLGMLRNPENIAAQLLGEAGITLERVQVAIDALVSEGRAISD